MRIGVLSDTHGHLDSRVLETLKSADMILHAGDIDCPEVLDALAQISTVIPIRGNMDYGNWSRDLPHEEFVDAANNLIYMIHDINRIDLDPAAANIGIVICGHTHRPSVAQKGEVLYVNPGSASFPRGGFKASIAMIDINGHQIGCRHITF